MGLSITQSQLDTLRQIIKTSIEHDQYDQPDFEDVELMRFNLDRAELLEHIEVHIYPCVSEVVA